MKFNAPCQIQSQTCPDVCHISIRVNVCTLKLSANHVTFLQPKVPRAVGLDSTNGASSSQSSTPASFVACNQYKEQVK